MRRFLFALCLSVSAFAAHACEFRPLLCDILREIARGAVTRPLVQELEGLALDGDTQAQLTMGMLYGSGKGVPMDETKAVRWFTQAAQAGNRSAQAVLGNFYASRANGEDDFKNARKWLDLAASGGESSAQTTLGLLHARGNGGPKDLGVAYYWFQQAAKAGDPEAKKYAEAIRPEMSEADLAAAQNRERLMGNLGGPIKK